jgi:hypothetical protein
MRNDKGQFTNGNSGRPLGSKNKLPNKEALVELVETIVDDLTTNYDKLNTNQKIRVLQHFNHLYKEDDVLWIAPEPQKIEVEIVTNETKHLSE